MDVCLLGVSFHSEPLGPKGGYLGRFIVCREEQSQLRTLYQIPISQINPRMNVQEIILVRDILISGKQFPRSLLLAKLQGLRVLEHALIPQVFEDDPSGFPYPLRVNHPSIP